MGNLMTFDRVAGGRRHSEMRRDVGPVALGDETAPLQTVPHRSESGVMLIVLPIYDLYIANGEDLFSD